MIAGAVTLTGALILASLTVAAGQALRPRPTDKPASPVVAVAGCAASGAEPHIWILSNATARVESDHPGLTVAEKAQLARQPLGRETYRLIGVADFVDAGTAARIGERGKILSPAGMNTTAMLVSGHKVAVKGLYIAGPPPRINLTSVAELGDCR